MGATVGLAWTEVGGSILTTEAAIMEGRGKLTTTGKLGDVMQESAQAAMSYVRSRATSMGLPRDFYRHLDIHLHVPEGRDSEGWAFGGNHHRHQHHQRADQHSGAGRHRHDRRDHGARARAADRRIERKAAGGASPGHSRSRCCPKDNEKDLPDIPENIRKDMKLHFVTSMDEVLKMALEREIEMAPLAGMLTAAEIVARSGKRK